MKHTHTTTCFSKKHVKTPFLIKSRAVVLCLFILHSFSFSIYGQNNELSIELKDNTLLEAFSAVEKNSNFLFNFKDFDIKDIKERFSLSLTNSNIEEVLNSLLKETNLTYEINGRHIAVSKKEPETKKESETKKVSGKVIDEYGEAIIGANIIEMGSTTGTITDVDGNYTIVVRDSKNSKIQISYTGYNSLLETVNQRTIINVRLEPAIISLNEVVAIGYGTQKRRQITGSVANVTTEDFNKGLTRDATDLLQGKVAGLMINSGSGDVTSGSTMKLRGVSTLLSDDGPLVVIDGVPGGDLSTVAPADIEAISVLKDATSAAIYGSRAAGGVVLITTKRGTGGKTMVNYNSYVSADVVSRLPKMLNATQYREINKNLEKDFASYDKHNANTDWFRALTRTGISQNHNLSLSGGTAQSNYRLSYTFVDRKGVMKDNGQRKHSFRFQAQQRALNNKLRIGLSGSAHITDQELPRDPRNYVFAYNMVPTHPIHNEDGSFFTGANQDFDQGNPVQNMALNRNEKERIYFYGVGDLQYDITKDLKVKGSFYKSRFSDTQSIFKDSRTKSGQTENGFASKENQIWDRNLFEFTFDYDTSFGDEGEHKVSAIAGYSWENNIYSNAKAQNRDFLLNQTSFHSLQSGLGLRQGDVVSSRNSYVLISQFARAYYGYDDRYMITAMLRRDGSSKFGKQHKWGYFPSVSLAWGVSQESFMQDVNWIDDLKLRVGHGITGNQNGLDPYKSLSLYEASGLYYEDGTWQMSYVINQNQNPDLRWESTATTNIGVDFSLLKGRLSGSIEWYNKRTKDMLYNYVVPTPPYVYKEMMANVGDMQNTGVEALINIGIIRQKELNWNMTLNASYNKNKIVRLSNERYKTDRIYIGNAHLRGESGVTTHVVEEGRPVGQFFMLESKGIDAEGKYIFSDLNGDGVINESDRTYAGKALPDVIFGWNNTVNYKRFDFSIFFRGTLGNSVLNAPRVSYANNTNLPGTNALDDPLTRNLREKSRLNSYYVENASFIRLDNMSLGYKFNTEGNEWISNARVYVAAQNLFVLTKYTGMDPEVDLGGLYPGIQMREYYPKARIFTVGLSLSF